MSVSIHTNVVYGVVVREFPIVREMTKYDPDTGKPYQAKVTTKQWCFEDNSSVFERFEVDEDAYSLCDLFDGNPDLSEHYDYERGIGVIGVEMAEAGDAMCGESDPVEIPAITDEHIDALKSLPENLPKAVYLFSYASC